MAEKKLYLIDGTNQVFRAYYAIKTQLTTSEGLPTNAVYGFARMLKKLLAEKNPAYVAAAFDLAAPTFRHKEYEEYKANRPVVPEDLSAQFPYTQKVCKAFGVPVLQREGFEADDIIGTVASKAEKEGFTVVIVASDKDLYQLINEKVLLLNPQKEMEEIDAKGVKKIFGVAPEQVVDVLGLWGDAVDNIPGIPGIGEKKAKEIILLYGSIENAVKRAERFLEFFKSREELLLGIEKGEEASPNIYGDLTKFLRSTLEDFERKGNELRAVEKDPAFLKKLEGLLTDVARLRSGRDEFFTKQGEATALLRTFKKGLREIEKGSGFKIWQSLALNRESAFMSQKLARIEKEVPIELESADLRYRGIKEEELKALFSELGFSSLLEEVEKKPSVPMKISYRLLTGSDEIEILTSKLSKRKENFFVLSEIRDDVDGRAGIVVSFHLPEEKGASALILAAEKQEMKDLTVFGALSRLFENGRMSWVSYDLKHSVIALKRRGITLKGNFFDLMLTTYLLDPSAGDFSFPRIVKNVLKEEYVEREADAQKELLETDGVVQDCCARASLTARIYPLLKDTLVKENLEELYETIEMPLIGVLADMEIAGVKIDVDSLKAMSLNMEKELEKVSEEIYTLAGERFNINSPKQLGDILFRKLGLEHVKRTPKSGEFSTGMEILEELSTTHALPKKILEYRSIAKIKSTYVDALPLMINHVTGRVHTSFDQTGTSTGRLSSRDPNLQNIPIRTEIGREIRKAFIPEEGYLLLCADYSQVELRILAHLSDDQDMISSFLKGEDIHRTTASKILGIPYEKITENHRRFAKTINFGILYGMSAFRLSKELGISRGEAEKFIDSYFGRFRRVKEYIDETVEFVKKEGYVTTLFGRVRYFKEIESKNKMLVQAAIRQAVNTTIQGTAADLIKKAMISIHRELESHGARMIVQVHDELVFEVPHGKADRFGRIVKDKMEGVYALKAPLVVNVALGKSWADAK